MQLRKKYLNKRSNKYSRGDSSKYSNKTSNKYSRKDSTGKFGENLKAKNWILSYFQFERILFKTKIGAGDVFVTSMIVPVLSTICAIFFQKYLPQASKQFLIQPAFNQLFFSAKGSIYFSIRPKDLICIFFRFWSEKKKINKNKKVKNNAYYS